MPKACAPTETMMRQTAKQCFPLYFFQLRPCWTFDRTKTFKRKLSGTFDPIILSKRKPGMERLNKKSVLLCVATMYMFQRHNIHVPATLCLANSSCWNLHLPCSSTTALMFQQPNLWQTRHAGASSSHAPAPQGSCSSIPISGKFSTLEPSPA